MSRCHASFRRGCIIAALLLVAAPHGQEPCSGACRLEIIMSRAATYIEVLRLQLFGHGRWKNRTSRTCEQSTDSVIA